MACEAADGGMCLADHIWALADRPAWAARDKDTPADWHMSILCWCPAAKHDRPKLQISAGKHKRLVWHCHAGCAEMAVRHALIKQWRISARCLPVSAELSNDIFERLLAIGESGELRHADARLLMVELLTSGKGHLPRGAELDRLAARTHVSRSEAYKALAGNPRRPK